MAKGSKKTTNATMSASGTYPSQLAYAEFHISTEHPGFAEGLEAMASAIGMSPKGAFYLLNYGFTQSLGDAIAGRGKALAEAKDEAGQRKYSDVETKVILYDLVKKRLEAIMGGEISQSHRGPRAKGVEKVMREIAWEIIKAAAVAKKVTLPKKSSEFDPIIDSYLAKHGEAAREEAERRMKLQADVGDVLDGLTAADVVGDSDEEEGEE